jgi:hypothetical protein
MLLYFRSQTVCNSISYMFYDCPFVSVKGPNHLPKRWLAHSLKTQEILAKKWALLRTSPNGPRAVFAGFLCVFKFTGSAAPHLGGLTRFFERTFFVWINIFRRLRSGSFGTDNTLNLTLVQSSLQLLCCYQSVFIP